MEVFSELDTTFEDFSLRFSDESRDGSYEENNNFGIIDKVDFESNTADINCNSDLICNESNVISNKQSRYEENNRQNNYLNQMINIPKLLRQLSSARVVLERLPISITSKKLAIAEDVEPKDLHADATACVLPSPDVDVKSSAQLDGIVDIKDTVNAVDRTKKKCKKIIYSIERYCPKCQRIAKNANNAAAQSCTKCKTSLDFKCGRCGKMYAKYNSLMFHLKTRCNAEYLNFKCPKCRYRTFAKWLLNKHLHRCMRNVMYRCNYCAFESNYKTSFKRHIVGVAHKKKLRIAITKRD